MQNKPVTPCRLFVIHCLSLALLATWLSGCGPLRMNLSENPQATQTSQAQRAINFATKSAGYLQGTVNAEAAEAEETQQAVEAVLLDYSNQPVTLSESFSDNPHEWPTGEDDGDLVSLNLNLQNGKYHWEMTAHEGFYYWTRPDMEPLADFYLTAQTQQVSGPVDGSVGLLLRQWDDENYYLFRISQDQYYSFYLFSADEPIPLIDWTPDPSIRPNEPNQLTVVGIRSHFQFFINGEWVDESFDSAIEEGRFGLVAGLFNQGETATVEFDDFVLHNIE